MRNLKRWLNAQLVAPTVKAVVRELDRAVDKLQNGSTASEVVLALRTEIAKIAAKTRLPGPLGTALLGMLLVAPWGDLAGRPTEDAILALRRLRRDVEGIRL